MHKFHFGACFSLEAASNTKILRNRSKIRERVHTVYNLCYQQETASWPVFTSINASIACAIVLAALSAVPPGFARDFGLSLGRRPRA
jgi:hypothetical protein